MEASSSSPSSSLVLYDLAGEGNLLFSPNCWRTRAALLLKGLEFSTESIKFTEIKSKVYAALGAKVNPKCGQETLPVLKHGDKVIVESFDIAEYLEATFPDRPSLFLSPQLKEACRYFNWQCGQLAGTIFITCAKNIYDILWEDDKEYFKRKVKRATGEDMEALHAKRDQSAKSVCQMINGYSRFLEEGGNNFLFGDKMCYADCVLLAVLKWLVLVTPEGEHWLHTDDGALEKWWQRVHAQLHL